MIRQASATKKQARKVSARIANASRALSVVARFAQWVNGTGKKSETARSTSPTVISFALRGSAIVILLRALSCGPMMLEFSGAALLAASACNEGLGDGPRLPKELACRLHVDRKAHVERQMPLDSLLRRALEDLLHAFEIGE
jgi:hypothetical protein